ncbi:MAG: tRNA lysidine(34) synthetase TilS [Caldilineales bacterium]|nr:tRNA lysidine(34) synthetase TilS [Caldilineales bacterium]
MSHLRNLRVIYQSLAHCKYFIAKTLLSILSNLRQFVQRHSLLPEGCAVVVGVSGGPDSLALAHALWRLSDEFGWQLHLAYLNHGLRPEAGEEADFVAGMAKAWDLPFTSGQADVPVLAAQPGVSVEEAARQARYTFLGELAVSLGATHIAVGHNADDQAETVIMHLLRGSGLAGLRGMLPRTPLAGLSLDAVTVERAAFEGIWLVRPWLQTNRREILGYLADNDLQTRQDASNTDTTFFRNRLRHEILPLLKEINPRLTRTLGHTALTLQGDYDTLAAAREQWWAQLVEPGENSVRIRMAGFRQLARGEQRALSRRAIAQLRPNHRNISWEHSERLLDILAADPARASGGPYPLVAGVSAEFAYDWMIIGLDETADISYPQIDATMELTLPGQIDLGKRWRLAARRVEWRDQQPWIQTADPNRAWLPIDVELPLTVRQRQTDDRMRPLGLGGSKPITDLMTDHKLPRSARAQWPLVVDGFDRILWMVGYRVAEEAKVADDARAAWELELRRESDPQASVS